MGATMKARTTNTLSNIVIHSWETTLRKQKAHIKFYFFTYLIVTHKSSYIKFSSERFQNLGKLAEANIVRVMLEMYCYNVRKVENEF